MGVTTTGIVATSVTTVGWDTRSFCHAMNRGLDLGCWLFFSDSSLSTLLLR